jgi:hypothetical protein
MTTHAAALAALTELSGLAMDRPARAQMLLSRIREALQEPAAAPGPDAAQTALFVAAYRLLEAHQAHKPLDGRIAALWGALDGLLDRFGVVSPADIDALETRDAYQPAEATP